MRTRWAWCSAAVMAAGIIGCAGDKSGEVTGTVLVDGKPAEKGAITFISNDGSTATAGGDIKDGKYSVRVPSGSVKVEIRVPEVVGKKKLYNSADSPYQDLLKEVLPEKYNNKTELTLDVKPGKNEKDWDLKTK